MAEYHVGLGISGIFAGLLKNQNEWKDKSECTVEASLAVAHYLLENDKTVNFFVNGQKYIMKVEKLIEVQDQLLK